MARMIAEVYDALKSAGADDDKARAAAIVLAETDVAFAEIRQQLRVLEWAAGATRRCWSGSCCSRSSSAERTRLAAQGALAMD